MIFDRTRKIIIDEPTRSVTLEKKSQAWQLTAPVEDTADPEAMDQLTGTLTSFTVGSVLSEKKDKYSTFDLDPAKATHLRVFEQGGEKPVHSPIEGWIRGLEDGYGRALGRFIARPRFKLMAYTGLAATLALLVALVLPRLPKEIIGMPDTDWVMLGMNAEGILAQMREEGHR